MDLIEVALLGSWLMFGFLVWVTGDEFHEMARKHRCRRHSKVDE